MRGDKHDRDVGPHSDMRDADQWRGRQIERRRRLDACDTIALCEGLSLWQHRQIDGRDAQRHFRTHDLKRLSVDLDERRPQRFVARDDLSEGFLDQFRRQVAFDAPSNRDI